MILIYKPIFNIKEKEEQWHKSVICKFLEKINTIGYRRKIMCPQVYLYPLKKLL